MKKGLGLYILALVLMILPFLSVQAKSQTVNDQEELLGAISDKEVDTIILNKDINTTQKITITRPLTIDGNNHTMTYKGTFKDGSDKTVWAGIYLLQFYKTTGTLKNIKLTGGNAALLVNGSTVHLVGKVDVSGNGFGGIELSQGKDVTDISKVIIDDDTEVVNTTDSENKPTVWVPSDSKDAIVELDGLELKIESGKELSITEFEDLLETENPKTFDAGYIYGLTSLLSTCGLAISFKKLVKLS